MRTLGLPAEEYNREDIETRFRVWRLCQCGEIPALVESEPRTARTEKVMGAYVNSEYQ